MVPVFLRCRQAAKALLLMVASLATVNALAVPDIQPVNVAPDVYYVQGISALGSTENQNFISNAGFVVTRDSVVMIDALGSPAVAERVVAQIRKITPKPISHVILTHYHADHVYGLQVFKALGAQVIAHTLGKAYLNSDTARLRLEASRKDIAPWIDDKTRLVPADVWLDGPTEMTIGGTRFVIQPAGPAHTPEDLAIYLPQQKVLFAGDIVFRNRIPYVGTADSRHWIASLDALLALDARTIVPGHGPASDEPKKDLQQTRDYLVFLRAAMKKAATDMTPFDEAYAATDWSRFESLPLFKVANRMNAYNTYLLMEQEAR
ncbi:MBL fold metallo-hydrolase [Variovorax sp. GB1P17]|uniref:MBL fold metallo-hydrolase n=1 Tax=Variovorax sp. GB1P17 TaxID=3443740 RepID=UPI003F480CF6